MPRRLRAHVPGGFYHVTLRGNHQQPVFRCDADHRVLNVIVARALETYGARLHAYCWMSNHLHFLIQVGEAALAQPMRQIAGEFARVMQNSMASKGHFFERRYHATLVEATDYLFTVLHYIHRNPLEAGIVGQHRSVSVVESPCLRGATHGVLAHHRVHPGQIRGGRMRGDPRL